MLVALVMPPTLTLTWTVPTAPGGLLAEMKVSPCVLKQGNTDGWHGGSVVVPNATAVAPVKPVPTISTPVPPTTGPWFGTTASTRGGDVASPGVAPPATAAPAKKTGRRMRVTLLGCRGLTLVSPPCAPPAHPATCAAH